MKFKKDFVALLIIFLAACNAEKLETITSPPSTSVTSTESVITPSLTRTSRPPKTPTPTLQPTETVPAVTLNAVATVDAMRIKLENQFPELQEYLSYCRPSYCQGVEISPDGQLISFSNGNVLELLEVNGKKLGEYSWYEIYGESRGYPDDYYEGSVRIVHWSKDGRYVYLATQHGDGGPGSYFGYKSALVRVNLQNGTWKDTGISGVLSFSPNDKYIVYSTNLSEIRVRNLQSAEEKIYSTPDYYEYFGEFVWSPDSKKIIFVASPNDFDSSSESFALYMIDLESDKNILLYEDQMPFYYPVQWLGDDQAALNKYQEEGTWVLDLSVDPPTIHP